MSDTKLQSGMKLGFGLMRLPKNADGTSSVEVTSAMVDRFLEAGGTYFDTAYAYGDSEATIKKALVDRYPRERYTLTTKLIAFGANMTEEKAKNQIYESLERTGAGYFDLYLLHSIQRPNYRFYEEYGLWDYVKELKAKGLIRHYGFSFHADPELLEELLTAHPDVEYVQLQVNYVDMENPGVNARKNLEICRKYGKQVIVMEPVKGGILADPIPEVKEIFAQSGRERSCAGWALAFAASQDPVFVVLSGMSNVAQMEDNLHWMKGFVSLDAEERKVVDAAAAAYDGDKSIPCTACHYCTKDCPMQIPIPEIFHIENHKKGNVEFRLKREYTIATVGRGKASDCLACGQCESACPQHLPIISLLEKCRAME